MKRSLLIALFSLILITPASVAKAATYYMATNGNDTNAGTISAPFKTIEKLSSVLQAGDTGYIRGGTYRTATTYQYRFQIGYINGTAANPIKIWAYPGEKPVFNLDDVTSTQSVYGLNVVSSSYLHVKGLRITGIAQNPNGVPVAGMVVDRVTNSTFELIEIDHIGGFGVQIVSGAHNNLFLNMDAHHLADPYSPYPWNGSNGFSITGGVDANNNTFDGCRVWWSSDDGFDLYGIDGKVTIKNSWAFWNGYRPGTFTPAGDGMGFKLGPTNSNQSGSVKRVLTNNLAFENLYGGFDQNGGQTIYNLYNNVSYKNGNTGYIWSYFPSIAQVFKNNISYKDPTTIQGNEISGTNNTWNGGVTVTDADFLSVSSAGADGPRQADGSLPDLNFLKLASSSDLINAGANVGLPYNGSAPDIGAYESAGSTTPVSTKFAIGDRVVVTATSLNVRGSASASGTLLGAQLLNSLGTVVGGPTAADGYVWWNINYDNAPDGWSAETYLEKYTAPSNTAPTANAGADKTITLPTSSVSLSGSGSDTNGTITGYAWTKVSGGSATISSPSSATTSVTGLAAGTYIFRLTVTDNGGLTGSDDVLVIVLPVAIVLDTTAPTVPTNLSGIASSQTQVALTWSASTDNVGVTGYRIYRAGSQIGTSVTTSYTNTGLSAGTTYSFTVAAYDAAGNVSSQGSSVSITTQSTPNTPPIANAGADKTITLPTSSVSLTGTASDPDNNTPLTYAWTKVSGGSATIASPTSLTTNITGLTQGTYTFWLTVTDSRGATNADAVMVTVNGAIAPVTGNLINVSTAVSDGGYAYFLFQDFGTPNDASGVTSLLRIFENGKELGAAHSLHADIRTYGKGRFSHWGGNSGSLYFSASDNSNPKTNGRTYTYQVGGIVVTTPQNPVANAGADQTITLPTTTGTLSGSGTDADGTITAYKWTKVSGPSVTLSNSTSATASLKSLKQGTYVFRLKVTDNSGRTATDDVTVVVNKAVVNTPPTANSGPNKTITLPTNSVSLSGSGADADGSVVSYAWIKVMGGSATIASPSSATTSITGLEQGLYIFRLTVTDNGGLSTNSDVSVTVNAAPANLINVSQAFAENGYAYMVFQDFGILPDGSGREDPSTLRIFENGVELGAAHSSHNNIRTLGQGRFSHWGDTAATAALYFSASDNSNPITNGRTYTYRTN